MMRPALGKFVLWHENAQNNVLDLSTISVLSISLQAVLTGKMEAERRRGGDLADCYSFRLHFNIPPNRWNHTGKYFVSNEGTRLYNNIARQMLKESLAARVKVDTEIRGMYESDSIHSYMRELDIYEDVSYWALKRMLARDRKKKKVFGM